MTPVAMIDVKCGIHPYTRNILARMSGARQRFDDAALDTQHPRVEPAVLRAIAQVDPLLVAVWELQGDGSPRWHLYRHWSPGKLDTPTHFMLLSNMGAFVPLDWRVVEMVRVAHSERDPVEFVKKYLSRQTQQRGMVRLTKDGPQEMSEGEVAKNPSFVGGDPVVEFATFDRANEVRKYYRRLFARSAWGSVGNCYERGIELPWVNCFPGTNAE